MTLPLRAAQSFSRPTGATVGLDQESTSLETAGVSEGYGEGRGREAAGVPVFRDLGNDKTYTMFTSCPLTWLGSKGIPVSSNPNVCFPHPTPSAQLPLQGCQEEVHTVGPGRLYRV